MSETTVEMPFTDNFVPYYYQIANLLRRRIEQGELAPGAKLPKELDLAKMFGVSRVPIRQALSLLEADGLILRRHGRGTFVAENLKKPQMAKLTGIIGWDVSIGTGHRLLSMEDIPPTPQLADFFDVSQDDRITRFRRLRMAEGTPFCFIVNYLPVAVARKVKKVHFRRNTMVDIIKNRLHIPLGKIQQTLEARAADKEIAAHLLIGVMTPVMYVETFIRDEAGGALQFSQMHYRGDRSKYGIEMVST